MKYLFIDRIFRLPRKWSNSELRKFASMFHGDIVNVSAWRDDDKQGGFYREYFINARSYSITNYPEADKYGRQNLQNEILLDLTLELPKELIGNFDVVFNHTTLEHIYDYKQALSNICRMTRDIVILVVPWLQQYHSDYGDYWRFSPVTLQKMFAEEGMSLLYTSFNRHWWSSVYIFAIASKEPDHWSDVFPDSEVRVTDPKGFSSNPYLGSKSIVNLPHQIEASIRKRVVRLINRLRSKGSGT